METIKYKALLYLSLVLFLAYFNQFQLAATQHWCQEWDTFASPPPKKKIDHG